MAELPAYPGTPRWVFVFGAVVVIALVALFVIRQLTMGNLAVHVR